MLKQVQHKSDKAIYLLAKLQQTNTISKKYLIIWALP